MDTLITFSVMEEETNYHTFVKICNETEAIYAKELIKIGITDKKDAIKNFDKLASIFMEHHPYDDIWNNFLKSAPSPLSFSHKNFSNLFFKYGDIFAEQWHFIDCDLSKTHWVSFFSLSNSKFLKCNFIEAVIGAILFEDIYFSECDFSKAYLLGIGRSVMQNCNFNHALIADMPLGEHKPTFNNCNMQGCELRFNKQGSYSTPKKILKDLNNIFSQEQLSSMNINFQGYSIVSKFL
jgi:uncharacterized protein YjbI with pentapeptide repeats